MVITVMPPGDRADQRRLARGAAGRAVQDLGKDNTTEDQGDDGDASQSKAWPLGVPN
jgi:hypothetical protein